MLAYRHGGGSGGNVGAEMLDQPSLHRGLHRQRDQYRPGRGRGGCRDGRRGQKRAHSVLRTRQRAVTPRDFERLAIEASTEVARARCLGPASPGGPIRLLIVPKVRREPESQTHR